MRPDRSAQATDRGGDQFPRPRDRGGGGPASGARLGSRLVLTHRQVREDFPRDRAGWGRTSCGGSGFGGRPRCARGQRTTGRRCPEACQYRPRQCRWYGCVGRVWSWGCPATTTEHQGPRFVPDSRCEKAHPARTGTPPRRRCESWSIGYSSEQGPFLDLTTVPWLHSWSGYRYSGFRKTRSPTFTVRSPLRSPCRGQSDFPGGGL